MKSTFFATIAVMALGVSAQYKLQNNGTITCYKAGTYCAGDSGETNILIHCNDVGNDGYAGNCNDNLAGVCGGVCEFAPCKQTCPDTGDGYCSVDGAIAANGTVLSSEPPSAKMARSFAA